MEKVKKVKESSKLNLAKKYNKSSYDISSEESSNTFIQDYYILESAKTFKKVLLNSRKIEEKEKMVFDEVIKVYINENKNNKNDESLYFNISKSDSMKNEENCQEFPQMPNNNIGIDCLVEIEKEINTLNEKVREEKQYLNSKLTKANETEIIINIPSFKEENINLQLENEFFTINRIQANDGPSIIESHQDITTSFEIDSYEFPITEKEEKTFEEKIGTNKDKNKINQFSLNIEKQNSINGGKISSFSHSNTIKTQELYAKEILNTNKNYLDFKKKNNICREFTSNMFKHPMKNEFYSEQIKLYDFIFNISYYFYLDDYRKTTIINEVIHRDDIIMLLMNKKFKLFFMDAIAVLNYNVNLSLFPIVQEKINLLCKNSNSFEIIQKLITYLTEQNLTFLFYKVSLLFLFLV